MRLLEAKLKSQNGFKMEQTGIYCRKEIVLSILTDINNFCNDHSRLIENILSYKPKILQISSFSDLNKQLEHS